MVRSRGFHQAPRRRKGWDVGPGQLASQTSISASGSTILSSVLNLSQDGLTLVRARGELTLSLSAASAAGTGYSGAFGIGLTTVAATAVGVTAVPTPITEQDWDGWIFWESFSVKSITGTIADGVNASAVILRILIDSKAMRKLTDDSSLYGALEVQEGGTAVLESHFDSCMLFALP